MKKISLLLSLVIISLASFGQYNVKVSEEKIDSEFAKRVNEKKSDRIHKGTKKSVNDEQVLWSEDFSGDEWLDESTWPEGWSNTDDSGLGKFVYINADTTHTGGVVSANWGLIPGATEGGMMHFPCDFYNTVEGSWPPETVAEGSLIEADVTLETGWIDITEATNGVTLRYATEFLYCCWSTLTRLDINVSTDGDNWTTLDGRVIDGNVVGVNTWPSSKVWEYNISSIVEGSDQVKIQFRMHGGTHHFWSIDDIALVAPLANDLAIVDAFATDRGLYTPEIADHYATLNTNYSEVPADMNSYVQFGTVISQGGMEASNVRVKYGIDDEDNESIWSELSMYSIETFSSGVDNDEFLFSDSTGYHDSSLPNAHRFYEPTLDLNHFESNGYMEDGMPYNFTYEILSDTEDGNVDNNFDTIGFAQTWGRFSYHWQPNFGADKDGDIGPFTYNGFTPGAGDMFGCDFVLDQAEGEEFKIYGVRIYIPDYDIVTFDASGNGVTMHPVVLYNDPNANGGDGGWVKNDDVTSEPYTLNITDKGEYVYLAFDVDDVNSYDFQHGLYRIGIEMDDYNGQKFTIGVDKTYRQGDYHFFMNIAPESSWGWYGPGGAVMIDAYTKLEQFEFDQVGIENVSKETFNKVKVYPNPSNGIVNIENVENSSISIYSISGILVRRFENKNIKATLDLSDLSRGTYLIKIVNESEVLTKKITMGK